MIISLNDIRSKLPKLPFTIILLIIFISCLGFVLMYSAAKGNIHPWAFKQILHFTIFFPLMIFISITDIKFWYKSSYLFYYLVLLLLVLVHSLGYTAMGATRWINLSIIKIQPSELMKIAIILALARYFHDCGKEKLTFFNIVISGVMLMLPAALIIKQPDLGTGLILLLLGIIIFFIAGINRWYFIIGFIGVSVALPIAWRFLYDYQKNRILTFLNPELDPLGSSYNIIQSKIAIGSGGFFGKGMTKGSQSQLQFLPEHQTDFIFTMLCEELGMLGGGVLLLIYSILIFYSYLIAARSHSIYGKLLALGVASMFFLHVFINIGMVMGVIPAVGVPLPILSYGGTSMMTILIGFGLIMNVHVHNRSNINSNLSNFF
ncbi:MAG: rod shape-determining protein RodA [Pseudomonadota bacterium]